MRMLEPSDRGLSRLQESEFGNVDDAPTGRTRMSIRIY
jgi:hypothetical protein